MSVARRLLTAATAAALAGALTAPAVLAQKSSSASGSDQTDWLDCTTAAVHTVDTCSQVADGVSAVVLSGDVAAPGPETVAAGDELVVQLSGSGAFIAAGGAFSLQSPTTAVIGPGSAHTMVAADTITVRAPASPGTATITVYYVPIASGNGVAVNNGTLTITWTATSALQVSEANSLVKIVADPLGTQCASQAAITAATAISSAAASGGKAHLCVAVNDGNGNAVAGATVSVTMTPVGLFTGGTPPPLGTPGQAVSSTTPASGIVMFDMQGSGVAGVATIGISVSQTIGATTVTTTFAPRTFTWTGPLASLTLTNVLYAIGPSFGPGHVATVVAKDAAGHDITSSSLCTGLSVANSPTLTGLSLSLSWDSASGVCYVDASTSSAQLGATSITVSSASPSVTSNSITLYVSGPPATATAAFSAATVAPGGTATFTVTAKDANGNPVPDGTNVAAVASMGSLIGNSGVGNATTANGVATFTYAAPNTTGPVTGTAIVGSVTASASTQVGAVPSAATSGTALGVTTSGPFSTTTKVQALGKYVTWKFSFGSSAAGQTVEIWRAVKGAGGVWSGFTLLTKRVANSNGDVFFYWRSSTPTWISVRGKLGSTYAPALQARWT